MPCSSPHLHQSHRVIPTCSGPPPPPTACRGWWGRLACFLLPGGLPLSLLVLGDDRILGGGWLVPGPCSPSCVLALAATSLIQLPLPCAPCPQYVVKDWPLGEVAHPPALWYLVPVLPLSSFRNAVYSTPRGFACPVSRRTWTPSLRKSGKTWRKGELHQRGQSASLALGHECAGCRVGKSTLHRALGLSWEPPCPALFWDRQEQCVQLE